MASEERLGASFSIDTTNLKAGLAQANRLIRESESEFKAAAAGMDDWTSSANGLSARNTHLTNTIDLQRKKVDALQKEYDRLISNGLDPMSKEAVDLRTKINNETTALNKNEKELKDNCEALEELQDQSQKTSDSTNDLGDSSGKANKALSALKVAGKIAAGAITIVAGAAVAGVAALLSLSDSTRELRTEMGRLETGFTTAGLSAEDATKTYDTLYGVLGDTGKASEAASHLALLANNSEDLSKWTDIATGVYATFGDSLPIEGLTEAANETAKVGDLTGVLADALNWAGVNEDDFQKKLDACNNEQERQKLITETLNELYKDSADKYKDVNKEIIAANEATNNLAQAQADLGAAAEPLNTQLDILKTNILTGLTPALQDLLSAISEVLNGADGGIEKLSTSIDSLVTTILEKATEMLPKIIEVASNIIFTIANTLIEQLPNIMQAAIQILTTLINTLAQNLPTLIPTIVDAVVLMAETLIDNIDLIIDAGINLILGLADGLIEALPRLIDKIPVIIDKLINAIVSNIPKLLEAGVKLILGLADGLVKAIPQLIDQLPKIITSIIDGLLAAIPELIVVGGQLIGGLIKGMADAIWEGIKGIGNSIVNAFKSFFGIHSPSKLFKEQIGSFMGLGLAEGIGEGFDKGIKAVNKSIVKSIDVDTPDINVGAGNRRSSTRGAIVVNQYNTYSQAHSRYELFKTKQQTAAAVRLAIGGVSE